jgi:hypothetical protein
VQQLRQIGALTPSFYEALRLVIVLMTKRDTNQPETPTDQVFTVPAVTDSQEKPDTVSIEKLEAQPMSYRRSRDVALMKLAFLKPENNERV